MIAAALLALTWSSTIASDQKGVSVETACVLGAGGLLIVGFLYVEKSYGEAAMMPLSLFGSASFIGLTLLTLLLYGVLGGLLLLVPYVLIEARGIRPPWLARLSCRYRSSLPSPRRRWVSSR